MENLDDTKRKSGSHSRRVILATLVAALSGIVAGALFHLGGKHGLNILCIVPLIFAAAAGRLTRVSIRKLRIHRARTAYALGLLTGVLLLVTMYLAAYLEFRQKATDVALRRNPNLSASEIEQAMNIALERYSGHTGFIGYVLVIVNDSMVLGSNDSPQTELPANIALVYRLGEALAFLLVPAIMARPDKDFPFCEENDDWITTEKVGVVSVQDAPDFWLCLAEFRFAEAGKLIHDEPDFVPGELHVSTGRCSAESPDGFIQIDGTRHNLTKTLLRRMPVTAEQYDALLAEAYEAETPDDDAA